MRAFWRVALPAARPGHRRGARSGAAWRCSPISAWPNTSRFPTFSTGIFRSWLAMGDKDAAMGLAALMLGFVAALVALEAVTRSGRSDSRDGLASVEGREPLVTLSPLGKLGAFAACALPVTLGFVVPALHLSRLRLRRPRSAPPPRSANTRPQAYGLASPWLSRPPRLL